MNEESEGGLSIRVLLAVLEPVIDWYQADDQPKREPLEILRDIVADLQTDRADVLTLRAQIGKPPEGSPPAETARIKESPAVAPAANCSLLVWAPHPENPRAILATSRKAPGITLFIIELCEDRDDRGQLCGAFIPDEIEGSTLYSRALVHWLKWQAESRLADFLSVHAENGGAEAPPTKNL